MAYKFIPTAYGMEIAIPDNLSAAQEAALIAQRLAEIDPLALAADRKDLEELIAHPDQRVPVEDILRELEMMDQSSAQDPP